MKNHGKTMKPHALPMRPKATFLPSAEDEDLQRELAALQRCDALRRDFGDLAARGTAAGGDLWTSAVEGGLGGRHEDVD